MDRASRPAGAGPFAETCASWRFKSSRSKDPAFIVRVETDPLSDFRPG
jgi:hypothetical protein